MNIYCIFFLAVLAVTVADLRSRNFSNIQPIEDFPLLQEKYPGVKYVGSLESSKIVGGNIAEPGQFPYQVDLNMFVLWDDIAFYRKCGASVISSEYVLTAAQCVVDYILELFIRFGVHNVYQHEDEQVEVQVSNDNIIIHPQWYWDWYTQTFQNDIALIKLDEPINFTPRIQAVALPTRSQADESFEYYYGIVTGWGQGSMDYESDELRFAELPIISNEECREWLLDSVICADTIYFQSPCLGDEGGPFVINQNGIMVQIGITSFFGGDFFDGSPAGFTRVTSFLDFIEDNSNIVIDP